MQAGLLCRDKARLDKMFLRYAYERVYKAAGLDLANEEAHNQFILAGSTSARLDELFESRMKSGPPRTRPMNSCSNAKKNVVTLSMAMIPQSVEIGGTDSGGLKRFVLISSIFLFVVGLGMLVATPLMVKSGKLSRENARGVGPTGMGNDRIRNGWISSRAVISKLMS